MGGTCQQLGLYGRLRCPRGVGGRDHAGLAGLVQTLAAELADGFEHREAGLAVDVVLAQERFADEGIETVENVQGKLTAGGRDGEGGVDGETSVEHGEAAEESLLVGIEQVVTPGNRIPQRLMSRWTIATPSTQQRKSVV